MPDQEYWRFRTEKRDRKLLTSTGEVNAMSKYIRMFVPGLSLHVMHRGHNKMPVFSETADCEHFLALLEAAAGRHDVSVHCYALMKNHYHLVATPATVDALPRAMQQLGHRYVKYFNRKYQRTGTLWGGRYRAILIADERYWLTCLRYVELNPVRAQVVDAPEVYRWSSYRTHALGERSRWLREHDVYRRLGSNADERQTAYRTICGVPFTDAELIQQRLGVTTGTERMSVTQVGVGPE
jgi:REP-associated tyrosine transposase